jgi:hypothetical protein
MARASSPPSVRLVAKQSTERHGHRWWRSSNLSYGAWNDTMILPTRSRRKEGGVLFYSLFTKQTIHGGLAAVVAWSSRSSTASHDPTHASPAPRSSPKALPWSPQASPQFNCFGRRWIELTRRLSSCSRVWGLQNKIRWARAAIYMAFSSSS